MVAMTRLKFIFMRALPAAPADAALAAASNELPGIATSIGVSLPERLQPLELQPSRIDPLTRVAAAGADEAEYKPGGEGMVAGQFGEKAGRHRGVVQGAQPVLQPAQAADE